ncbi:DegT/DnrJ/EryC1/StrS family aminotransferase [Hymenobacter busanensis]|uniref:DegT/DnrJ/EryC1/StrS family aminotransferase n=1 Tax=Hymenobacter busanensis TaxID=2607656 RepID=A0A7L4ZX34_9BACT|nr:DegT/DnrJ/EryC1/StrS family aminotransferase [Hymenobacter busanensis]KAA9332258.1 DegT/DnrJ/EryC1/StrS family aminotransferase [Hymenobacter busanensis]QHJ07405.1 aminotransferase class I/II-fold pyridoxal phosphate-dependent enzyme [Hymenobacter busanensis]
MQIPFLSLAPQHEAIREEMLAAFAQVYDSNWYVLGPRVTQFEAQYAAFSGTTHCIGVANGLDALHLSLKALGVGPGDEVIVPSNTYIATWLAVSYVGATVVPVEPNEQTYNIEASSIEAAITPRTKAIMPVHLYGQACSMNDIMVIAQRYGLWVVEDNAQAHGAQWKGQFTGSFGHANATSFYPGKNLGALGDAGAITTFSTDLDAQIRVLRNYGSQQKYLNQVVGHNSRLDELQAALLSVKLPRLNDWTAQRQQLALHYNDALRTTPGITLPTTAIGATHVYHLYVIRNRQRDALQHYLAEQGIGTLIHYPTPPHLQEAYKSLGYSLGDFPIAEELARTSLSLPLWPGLTENHITYIAEAIQRFASKHN